MLYTEKEKNEIERVRKVFEKHIRLNEKVTSTIHWHR